MARRTSRLTVDALRGLDAPLRQCLCWELDPVRRGRVDAADASGEKEAWLSEVLREWGSCGQVATVADRTVGLVVYVPAALAPGAAVWPTAPVSPDAVVMTTVWVDPAHRDEGLGRTLVQAMAADLIRRGGVRAVEAFGATNPVRDRRCAAGCTEGCVVPAGFLEAVGFRTQRGHALTPRMRMDLRSTLRWRGEVEHALDRLVGAVRPPVPVSPVVPRTRRGEPATRPEWVLRPR